MTFQLLNDCDDTDAQATAAQPVKIPDHPWSAAIDNPEPVAPKTAQQLLMGDDVVNTPEYIAANSPGGSSQGRSGFWHNFLLQ